MANMVDYLDWRGDLTFQQAPFCEVDNLLLAELAYVDFTGIVPEAGSADGVFLRDASDLFWESHSEEGELAQISMTRHAAFVMRRMAETARYQNVCLSSYVREIDLEEQSQFAAVCISLDDNSLFVSYSGTDNTIVGWREDFNMAYLDQTPGQKKAVDYLNQAAANTKRMLRVGGHSKGGNLAVYASAFCDAQAQDRIVEVYSNDGPGFGRGMLQQPSYQKLMPRIHRVLPQRAIVGMLFSQQSSYQVVHSNESYARQHDMLSWEVLGPAMVYEVEMSEQSRALANTLNSWINSMEVAQRQRFIETVFSILDRAGVQTVDDFYHMKWKRMSEILRSQRDLSEEERAILGMTWRMLLDAGGETLRQTLQDKVPFHTS